MDKPKRRNVTLILPLDLVEWLDREAKAERRSRAQHLAYIIEHIKTYGWYSTREIKREEGKDHGKNE